MTTAAYVEKYSLMENLYIKCGLCFQEFANVTAINRGYENVSKINQYLRLIFKYASVQPEDICTLICQVCRYEIVRTCRYLQFIEQAPVYLHLNKQKNGACSSLDYTDQEYSSDSQLENTQTYFQENGLDLDIKPSIDIVEHDLKLKQDVNSSDCSDQTCSSDDELEDTQSDLEEDDQEDDDKCKIEIVEHHLKIDDSDFSNSEEDLNIHEQNDETPVAESEITNILVTEDLEVQAEQVREEAKRVSTREKVLETRKSCCKHCPLNKRPEKLYSCKICAKAFSQPNHLKRHSLIHNGNKPFKCNLCSKAFFRKDHLQKHQSIHINEKPFRCNICTMSFSQKGNLERHSLTHNGEKPFKCNICSKSFSQDSNLQAHKLIHKGEKPFSCNICGKDFLRKGGLKRHSLIHKEPYRCNICSQAFFGEG